MNLSYRGQTYTASTPAIEATGTEETVTFLGRSARVKQFTIAQRQQPTEALICRGHRYTR